MPPDIERVPLLDQLRQLRRSSRRFSASIITTYAIHPPFYEDVVLRYLQAAGSRLNIVLVDAGQLAKAFTSESARPRRAGLDYVLIPIHVNGSFHPKIIALFSDNGAALCLGSHNLTEAGFGRNGELCAAFGFDRDLAPPNILRVITEFVLSCARELAPGDSNLSQRLHDRILALSKSNEKPDDDVAFIGTPPSGRALLDLLLTSAEWKAARRILVLGPYFDTKLRFLAALRKRAPQAEIVVAVQPEHVIMKDATGLPARTRLRSADALLLRQKQPFIHAKALVVECGKQTILCFGSANPSGPAWLNDGFQNIEAVLAFRNTAATKTMKHFGLDRLWDAPAISKNQLIQIQTRSQAEPDEADTATTSLIPGLWNVGWVTASTEKYSGKIRSIINFTDSDKPKLSTDGATIQAGVIRFAAPGGGTFAVDIGEKTPLIVFASSAATLASSLSSGKTARLIDELGRLDDGGAPGDELLDLCEQVLMQTDDDENISSGTPTKTRTRGPETPSDDETHGPRGISIGHSPKDRSRTHLDLDISSIITLLLRDLDTPKPDLTDPTAEDDAEPPEDDDQPPVQRPPEDRRWENVVQAIRPRLRRLINRLDKSFDDQRSAKWKFERSLVLLALFKRLRRWHPGDSIRFSGRPEHLASDEQVRDAFKLAIRCWFARENGIFAQLAQSGGFDEEHDIVSRALLLWAAYEAGMDVGKPKEFNLEPEELHALQSDRTDALVAAIAASASPQTLERARRELFNRGLWHEFEDQPQIIEGWFGRHSKIGLAFQSWLTRNKTSHLPILTRTPNVADVVVWKQEPAWPRFPQMVSGRTVYLADVGDAEPIKITQQFVQPVDIDVLGIRNVLGA